MKIEISDELGLRLKELAEDRNLSVEEMLSAMIDRYSPKRGSATLADLARIAREANLSSEHPVDTAARSREILSTEREQSPDDAVNDSEQEYPPGSLARFAQLALEAGLASSEPVDTSARSREILKTEFADYVDRRSRR